MIINNFKLTKIENGGSSEYSAFWGTVEVTTGSIFKKTIVTDVFKTQYSDLWRWSVNGEFTPVNTVENIVLAYVAEQGKIRLEDCV